MRWLLLVTHLQLFRLCILSSDFTECEFPKQWRGRWFQSGVEGLVTINGSIITGKGRCIDTSGEIYLIQDQEDKCYRCMVVHDRHYNVLQYKETYCMTTSSVPSLQHACNQLTGDATLYSLFRSGAAPSPCPIKGPLEFTYSHGLKECNTPLSQAEACTQESRILLRYQACANVHSSESVDIELECLATWKEGSTQNLVARRHGSRTMKDEDSYRCFIYAKTSNDTWSVAESADAACTGLISVNEGAKVLKLKRKNPMERCMYPSWLVSAKSWVALDPVSSRLLASTYNLTILDRDETQLSCYNIVFDDRRHHHHSRTPKETQVRIVAKATRDCKNGYVCLVFHKRDEYVIEMQQSEWSVIPNDVCNENVLSNQFMPYKTFTASDPMTRQCPHSGHYEIVSLVMKPQKTDYNVEDMQLDTNGGLDTQVIPKDMPIQTDKNIKDMTQPSTLLVPTISPKRCFQGNGRQLNIGCKTPDRMEIATSCGNEALSEYSCHGTWIENDTAYLVASTDDGRYCIVYSASAAVAAAAAAVTAAAAAVTASATTTSANGQLELSVTGHLSSCPRTALHRHSLLSWQVNLTSYAQCDDVSSASPWTSHESLTLLRISLLGVILLGRYIAR